MRGKLRSAGSYPLLRRITPADAGKTGGGELSGGDVEDHPRRCGENLIDADKMAAEEGSPPQVRGKPV